MSCRENATGAQLSLMPFNWLAWNHRMMQNLVKTTEFLSELKSPIPARRVISSAICSSPSLSIPPPPRKLPVWASSMSLVSLCWEPVCYFNLKPFHSFQRNQHWTHWTGFDGHIRAPRGNTSGKLFIKPRHLRQLTRRWVFLGFTKMIHPDGLSYLIVSYVSHNNYASIVAELILRVFVFLV